MPEAPPGGEGATPVLVTRPADTAAATAAQLVGLGHPAVIAPMMTIERRTPAMPKSAQAVLLTSANALDRALGHGLEGHMTLTVGDATAARARALGIRDVRSAGRDAAALVELVRRTCIPNNGLLLLLCGEGQGRELVRALRDLGFVVGRRVTYAAVPARELPAEAVGFLRAGVGSVMFYSPATAQIFVRLARRAGLGAAVAGLVALAISPATAAALSELPWAEIRTASSPNQEALLALLP